MEIDDYEDVDDDDLMRDDLDWEKMYFLYLKNNIFS